jgi:nucleoside-diphosphate-sugar epimerase
MQSSATAQRILIIGGSGFLSGALARQAVAQGHQVWVVTRGQRPIPAGVTNLVADRHDQAAFEQTIRAAQSSFDLVIDCIGYQPADLEQDIALFRHLTPHLIFVSTDFVYDPARRRFPQREETDAYLSEGYGGQKRLCELALIQADTTPMVWTILRPCHIYGPGSQLGCLPLHSRDPEILTKLSAGEPLTLVGGGHFLQQPILARDLADLILSMGGKPSCFGQIFCAAGPDSVESRAYYQIIADILRIDLTIKETPVDQYLAANPGAAPFLCHRIYDLRKLQAAGVKIPATPLAEGLREHVNALLV